MTDLHEASPPLAAALVGRFLIELALLAGAGIAAWRLTPGGWAWITAIAAPVLIAVVWGLLLSPRARVPLPAAAKLTIETLLFAGVGGALAISGLPVAAAIGFCAWAADRILIAALTPRTRR